MSVRRKTLFTFGLTSIVLLGFLLVFARLLLLSGYDHLQEEAVQQNVQRVRNVIDNEIESINSFAGDWAYWDDTYQFAQNRNQDYLDSNLTDESISNLGINLFMITDLENNLIFGTSFDLENNRSLPLPIELYPQATIIQPILELPKLLSNNTGIIISQSQPILIVSRSILTSQKEGPSAGKLVMARLLNDSQINGFAQQTQLVIDIQLIDSTSLSEEFLSARTSLINSDPESIVYRSYTETAEGYSLIRDITGNPALILRVGMPNAIIQQGQQTVLYFIIAMLLTGVTLGAVIMWSLEKIVLARLAYLNRRVQEIASTGHLSERIVMEGNDELSSLSTTINNSLGVMEKSRLELKHLNGQLEEKINDLNLLQAYRDRFFTNAAHEFRTPMAVLRTQIYLAQKEPALWQKHLEVLSNATNQLTDILNDVFDMAQFKRQRGTGNRQDINLGNLLTSALAEERPRIYQRNLQVSTYLPDHSLFVQGDQGALGQAIEKLMGFIVHTCTPGSAVDITLSELDADHVRMAHLEIRCTGMQLDPTELKHIFMPFYKSSEGNGRNSGLQLSIAKEVIAIHSGEIYAETQAENTTQFGVKLPLAEIVMPALQQ